MIKYSATFICLCVVPVLLVPNTAWASATLGNIHPWWLIILSLSISLLPMLMGMASAYIKMSIVLNLLRSGFGAQGVPSGLVIMALSTALTCLVMGPVLEESLTKAENIDLATLEKSPNKKLLEQISPVLEPWKTFLEKHAGEREIQVLLETRQAGKVVATEQKTTADTQAADVLATEKPAAEVTDKTENSTAGSFGILLPAFLLTELREAFAMGFALLIPFLALDLIVANILTGMGMQMASPSMIALPLKVLLFLLVDGWLLLSRGLVFSYAQ